ncbi:placenta-specific gene 8 protein [Lingula anatina]|uniref:Placenta-specific gene 8 protein n=1 Tax=Lingula anatina TaxID=7574 RepID=A0A1S3IK24_LINAN|nr:placenta-specific gene 8 protein [Lingula anatina]|eukprot:XP_013397869.1 placenta-specific gene 8 protein [Lingula anatina]
MLFYPYTLRQMREGDDESENEEENKKHRHRNNDGKSGARRHQKKNPEKKTPRMPVTQQITKTVKVTSSGGARTVKMDGLRDWSSGIFGCFSDVKSCLCGLFCFPCLTCQTSTRMGEHCCVPFMVPGGLITLRTRLRSMLGIEGTICGDCCATVWCPLCVTCQMKREMDSAGW